MASLSEKYWAPTPKFYRALGDTLLALGSIVAGYGILEGSTAMSIVILVASVIGKFFTNFATENGEKPSDQ